MAGSELKADLWINDYMTPWDVYAHGVTSILASHKTQYQEMYVIETGNYGKALVLDGKWQSCTGDEFLYHEPLVHPAMLAHGAPKKVLILGGAEGATVREALRWKSVEKVAMVDIDGEVVDACKKYLPEMHQGVFEDPRLELVIDDALKYINETQEKWDIVISDLSDPIEEGPSFQLFTKEYFGKISKILTPTGRFVVQAGPVSPGEMAMHVKIVNTMQAVYPYVQSYSSYVPTYGMPWGFVLGSQEPINTRPDPAVIDQMLEERTTGGFRMFDGVTMLGLFQLPLHLRRAIAAETDVYTLASPPKFFGKGTIGV